MNQVLFRKSFLVLLATALQAIAPPVVAVASLFVTARLFGATLDPYSTNVAIIAVLCLVLVQTPRDISAQLRTHYAAATTGILARWAMMLSVLLAVGYVTKSFESYRRSLLITWALATPVLLVAVSAGMEALMKWLLINASDRRSAIFAGLNEASVRLAQRLRDNPSLCVNVAGFFDDRSSDRLVLDTGTHIADGAKQNLLGKLSDMGAFVNTHRIDIIFVALPIRHIKRVMALLDDLRDTTASIYFVPDVFVFDLIQARSDEIQGIPVVAMCETPFYGYRGVSKRIMDVVISAAALLILSPLFLAIGLLVKLSSPGPVVFKQRRYGLDGHEITVYKFRSMKVTEDGNVVRQASKSDSRITPIGAFLRRSSLDEIPQLINVLQGRMSLVGPRPHAVAHNEQYRKLIKGYMIRHKVLPGITGLAQVSGCRGETARLEEMQARINFDLNYLRHWSLMLDIKILFLTVFKVFRDEKAY